MKHPEEDILVTFLTSKTSGDRAADLYLYSTSV